ncbi:TetR/AcrR family transcriptional regulator [Demequina sp. NBRC 110054]|uniref:TetR/AcrR family transcriptional regulator n=1 Tax=Demequina sp. NBRC 110054 TaxID=1570343 RepID=UPI00190EDD0C|nr:TetR/AcrR family transcriptional regulator [Demequina sp. NBRC 110054]
MPTADTRALILDAARTCVLDEGYASLSTRKVAELAGVPLSQIHYHFGSKDNLVLALLDHEDASRLDRQAALYAGDEPLSEQWARACDYLDDDLGSGYVRILQEMFAAGYSQPALAARLDAMMNRWIVVLTDAFAHHMDRGLDLGPLTPAQLASLAGNVFLGAEQSILIGHEHDAHPAREALRAVGGLIAAAERRAGLLPAPTD